MYFFQLFERVQRKRIPKISQEIWFQFQFPFLVSPVLVLQGDRHSADSMLFTYF